MKKPVQTVSEVDWLLKEWDFDANLKLGLSPNLIGSQSNKTACWKCKFGHTWTAKINNRFNGSGCPECRRGLKTSFPEQAVFFYLKSIFPDAVNSYKDIFSNRMELDIFLPSINVGIEYDGIAWHGEDAIEKERRKYEICKQNSIQLIRLLENEKHVSNELLISDKTVLVTPPFSGSQASHHALDDAITKLFQELSLNYPCDGNEKETKESIIRALSSINVNTFKDRILILQNYLAVKEDNSFGSAYPEIAKFWHPTKNGYLTPYMFPPHTNTVVWWHGKCGHEWENPIALMSRGYGCPYCHGLRVLKGFNDLESVYPEIASQWHPTKNGNNKPDMFTFGSGHKAYWLCPVCNNEWKASINNRTTSHHNCPYCSHQKPIKGINDLTTARPDLMAEWNYDKNVGLDPSDYMEFSNKKVWWKCQKCGYEYSAFINNRSKGNGCKKCAGMILIPGKNDLKTLFPAIADEWDYEKNIGTTPSEIFPQTNKKYHWKCKFGHQWIAAPNCRVRGTDCPYCSGNIVQEGYNDLSTTHPQIAAEWHPFLNGNLLPTQVSRGCNKKIWFKCSICENDYESYIGNKIKGYGKCPFCSTRKTRARRVLNVESGETFATLKEAARSIGKEKIQKIQQCCAGRIKTAYGYHWKYIDVSSDKQ